MSSTEQKVSSIVNAVVNDTIDTPIAVLKERYKDVDPEDVVSMLNATISEMIKLQYKLRELSIIEWYDKLDDSRKHLHDVFERNREFFKAGAQSDNWLALSYKSFNGYEQFNGLEADDKGPYHFKYFKNTEEMTDSMDRMRQRDVYKVLCTPLFKAT